MAEQPRVSIGLPVYNGENYLAESLDALLSQTYPDFELIISDNASTDPTEEICRKYARPTRGSATCDSLGTSVARRTRTSSSGRPAASSSSGPPTTTSTAPSSSNDASRRWTGIPRRC